MHNLYFPWIRILIFCILFSLPFYGKQFLKPSDPALQEADFSNYKSESEERFKTIEYILNGSDRKLGNLIGIQPFFLPLDFYSAENFKNSLRPIFEKAKADNLIDRKTLIILPEHVGTGLYLLKENKSVYTSSYSNALTELKSSHKLAIEEFQKQCNSTNCSAASLEWETIIREKKDDVAKIYNETFSELAKEYSVSIIAGSVILPEPKIVKGELVAGDKESKLYNVSITYLPNGKAIDQIIKKINLSNWEKEFLTPGELKQDLIIAVPGWKVGVLIGIDSFYSSVYSQIAKSKVDGLVSPASNINIGRIQDESNKLLELQEPVTWHRYSLKDRSVGTNAKVYLQVFWDGNLWDIKDIPQSFSSRENNEPVLSSDERIPKILNLYF